MIASLKTGTRTEQCWKQNLKQKTQVPKSEKAANECVDYKSWFCSCSDGCRWYQSSTPHRSLVFLCCTKWCIGSRPSSQLIVLFNAGSTFPFDLIFFYFYFIFFSFVVFLFCHFASVYLFVEFDRRWRRKSNERCVECARLGRLVLTAFFDHVQVHGTVTADRRNRSIATILSNSTIQAPAVASKNRLADDVGL